MKTIAIKKLESAFNHYLSLDPDSSKSLASLQGRVLGIHVHRPKIAIFFSFHEHSVQISTEPPEKINTEIYSTLFQLMRLKLSPSPSFINAQFHIKGDVDTAQLFNELLQKHQIDWEEHLSKIVGDVTAYKMSQLFRKPAAFIKTNKSKLINDCSEYLQEEIQVLPSNNEVKSFRQEVEALRLQIDRLQARVDLLKKKL